MWTPTRPAVWGGEDGDIRWSLRVTLPAAFEPVSLDDAKARLRVTTSDEDDQITALIVAAREQVEADTNLRLLTTELTHTRDRFPASPLFALGCGPLQDVTSVTWIDLEGEAHTLAEDAYYALSQGRPGRLALAPGASWPTNVRPFEGVSVAFDAGYGDTADAVPMRLKLAILVLVGHWYDALRNGLMTESWLPTPLPMGYDALISDRVRSLA